MDAYDVCVCLLVMVGTMALTACCRELARRFLRRRPHVYSFALELSGAFQICACTHELCLLGGLLPEPHLALALVYLFTVLHSLLLTGSIINPSSSFQLFCSNRSTVKAWAVQTCGQFLGALLANVYMKAIWALGTIPAHSSALGKDCSDPIQTTIATAFVLELLFSSVFHLALKELESTNHSTKVHLLALLITAIVFKGWFSPPPPPCQRLQNQALVIFNYGVVTQWPIDCFPGLDFTIANSAPSPSTEALAEVRLRDRIQLHL